MYALIMTLVFFTADPNTVAVDNTILTKTEKTYFTQEECLAVRDALYSELKVKFDARKKEGGAKDFYLSCSNAVPLLPTEKKDSGAIPVPKKGSQYKFNGAMEI